MVTEVEATKLRLTFWDLMGFVAPWAVACQSMGFSRQEYWSGLPFPYPGDLPNPGIEAASLALQADALPSELPGKPREKPTFSESF